MLKLPFEFIFLLLLQRTCYVENIGRWTEKAKMKKT